MIYDRLNAVHRLSHRNHRIVICAVLLILVSQVAHFVACDSDVTGGGPPVQTVIYTEILVRRVVLLEDSVQADGSDSHGGAGRDITYEWSLIRPPASQTFLRNPTQAITKFKADAVGTFNLRLIVDDTQKADTAYANATSRTNVPPVAVALPEDTTVAINTAALLRGSGTDLDSDSLSYRWDVREWPSGSSVDLTYITANPHFIPDKVGQYKLVL
jgi:hypothetical protein